MSETMESELIRREQKGSIELMIKQWFRNISTWIHIDELQLNQPLEK